MQKKEIDELINIYEKQGTTKLIMKLYEIQKKCKEAEMESLLAAYMHLTNKNNNSYFYTSDKEQIVTNNTGSVIYFNKNIFNFKNINDKKIVINESFKINEEEIMEILGRFRTFCGKNITQTNDIEFVSDKAVVSTKHNSAEFNKQELELVAKLLNYPSFNLSDNSSSLYMQSNNGYAYILGKRK